MKHTIPSMPSSIKALFASVIGILTLLAVQQTATGQIAPSADGYLQAHHDLQTSQPLSGGPLSISIDQDAGGVFVGLPDQRQLDPAVFGTPDTARIFGGTPLITGVPDSIRQSQNGAYTKIAPMSPFGDKHAVFPEGQLDIDAFDRTATDAAVTSDSVRMVATWTDTAGNTYEARCCNMMIKTGLEFPTFGGVVTNHILHGFSGIGTPLMPSEYTYFGFWGMGSVLKNGEVMDQPRVIHGMLTEYVRDGEYQLAFDSEVNPGTRHFHLMISPFMPNKETGSFQRSPVSTGFTLPNGKELPFWHVMFESLDINAERTTLASAGSSIDASSSGATRTMSDSETTSAQTKKGVLPPASDGYLQAHRGTQDPHQLLGGPISMKVSQNAGGAFVALPDKRQLDPAVFGTPDTPRLYGGTPMITGVPPMLREFQNESYTQIGQNSPFGDKHAVFPEGELQLEAQDVTATDAAVSSDSVHMEASWSDSEGNTYTARCCKMMIKTGLEFPTFGGVVTNHILHGFTGIGTPLMPSEYSYLAFWGMGSVMKNGEVMDQQRVIHGMLTEYVRNSNYELAFDSEVDPQSRHFHLMISPFMPNKQTGSFEQSPVNTGYTLGNGKELPFWHVMFESLDISSSPGALASAPQDTVFHASAKQKTEEHPFFNEGFGSGYEIDTTEGKELTLERGQTYAFVMEDVSSIHPFYITTSIEGADGGNSAITNGVSSTLDSYDDRAWGQNSQDTLYFTPNTQTPDTVYYNCTNHAKMGYRINIVDDVATDIKDEPGASQRPTEFALDGNYPNPFNPTTNIQFDLPEAADVTIEVFSSIGRKVKEINVGKMSAGSNHHVQFDGSGLSSGMYLYRIRAETNAKTMTKSGKMLLMK